MPYELPQHPLTVEQAIARQEGWYEQDTVTRNQRNNNPGNLEYGTFAIRNGATKSDGRFAIFPTPEAGFAALSNLLRAPHYINLTIEQAIRQFAPSSENDTEKYVKDVCYWTGYTQDYTLNSILEKA